jgi:hypothetical protein
VVASDEVYGASETSNDVSFAGVTSAAAGSSGRLYALDGSTGKFLPGWPVAMPGLIQNELPLIGPGQDAAIVKLGGQRAIIASTTGGALEALTPAGTVLRTYQQVGPAAYGPASDATDRTGALNLFESASVGDLLGSGNPDVVKYEISLSQAANLLLVGQNFPYNHLIAAYDGSTSLPLPAYPTITDDYQLLSASNIARMLPGARDNQVLTGTGLGILHAYDGVSGRDIAGFPKVTGGWLFAPSALATDGRLADITREGYLFEWKTSAPACQSEWPQFRHDPEGTGNYDYDGVPPGPVRSLRVTALGPGRYRISFISPGDNGLTCGTPAAYVVRINGRGSRVSLGTPVPAGQRVTRVVHMPASARTLTVLARNRSGVLGYPATVDLRRSASGRRGQRTQPSAGAPGFTG